MLAALVTKARIKCPKFFCIYKTHWVTAIYCDRVSHLPKNMMRCWPQPWQVGVEQYYLINSNCPFFVRPLEQESLLCFKTHREKTCCLQNSPLCKSDFPPGLWAVERGVCQIPLSQIKGTVKAFIPIIPYQHRFLWKRKRSCDCKERSLTDWLDRINASATTIPQSKKFRSKHGASWVPFGQFLQFSASLCFNRYDHSFRNKAMWLELWCKD